MTALFFGLVSHFRIWGVFLDALNAIQCCLFRCVAFGGGDNLAVNGVQVEIKLSVVRIFKIKISHVVFLLGNSGTQHLFVSGASSLAERAGWRSSLRNEKITTSPLRRQYTFDLNDEAKAILISQYGYSATAYKAKAQGIVDTVSRSKPAKRMSTQYALKGAGA